ncbi:hypothetical protein GYMLUDRAFT_241079 [Collybiopsis luxurians FD-317 M1]|nr:hypothetical protein GYMLUDRAFT_241079 [Collybiopsis luxurians FD-317 M1]
MAVGLGELSIIAVFVESVLYGFFLLLALIAVILVMRRRHTKHSRSRGTVRILGVILVMFLLATLHLSIHLQRTLYAFFDSSASTTDTSGKINPISDLDEILVGVNSSEYILKTTTYFLQTYVGDAFVIYRLYVVWGGNKKVLAPMLALFLASVGISIYVLQRMAQGWTGASIFESWLYDPVLLFFVLTLITNLASTVLIAGRIYWLHRQVKEASEIFVSCPMLGTSARAGCSGIFIAGVISESGAIYSATLLAILICYSLKMHIVYLLIDAVRVFILLRVPEMNYSFPLLRANLQVTQLIGIVFAFVLIRVAVGVSTESGPPMKSDSELASTCLESVID